MNRGFTLIELLISAALASVLSLLVFAGYDSIRERARTVECAVRLRALGQGIMLHTTEQGGRFPKSNHSGAAWTVAIAPYLGEPVLENGLDYRNRKAFVCPANKAAHAPEPSCWSYGLNVFFELSPNLRYTPAGLPILGSRDSYKGSPATWNRMSDILFPGRTVMVAENPHQVSDHFMAHQWSSTGTARNAIACTRHQKKSHFLFVDGHLEALEVEETFDPTAGVNLWNPSLAR